MRGPFPTLVAPLVLGLTVSTSGCAQRPTPSDAPGDTDTPAPDPDPDPDGDAIGVVGSAASLPPTYARTPSDPDAAPECAFDADCKAGDLCDHGQCMAWWRMKGEVPEVSPETLYWQVQRGEVQVLDVRTAAEFGLGRIPGAIHVPIQKLERRLEPGGEGLPLDPERPVVAICLTAHRSIAAVRLLSRHGYDVVQLQGGMTRWARERLPVVRGRVRSDEALAAPDDAVTP